MIENTGDALDGSVKLRLLDYWSRQGNAPAGERKTATPEEVDRFEDRYGVRFPEDFRDFLEDVGGFDQNNDDYQDSKGFNFWPLSKLSPVSEYQARGSRFPDERRYFIFCDYLDFSWAYAIRLGGGKHDVVLVGTSDGKPKRVAQSFSSFIDDYLRDAAALYP